MVRTEHIVDLDRVRDEIEVYNALIPDPGQLSATMLIEITETDRIQEQLVGLIGIDEAVRLEIGERIKIRGGFEAGHSKEDKLSAVQYVRFPLDREARQAFIGGSEPVRLVIDHPKYRCGAAIEGAVRASLARDLEAT